MATNTVPTSVRMTLAADCAADLMTPNPVSIRDTATIQEAVLMLTEKSFSAAPVIDQAGRPVGVVSRADIIIHDREKVEYLKPVPPEGGQRKPRDGFQVVNVDPTLVRDIMTPVVFAVHPGSPVSRVVGDMLAMKVHRLFVVDDAGILVGVISTVDILRHLSQ